MLMVSRASGDLLLGSVFSLFKSVYFTSNMFNWLIFELVKIEQTPTVEKFLEHIQNPKRKSEGSFELKLPEIWHLLSRHRDKEIGEEVIVRMFSVLSHLKEFSFKESELWLFMIKTWERVNDNREIEESFLLWVKHVSQIDLKFTLTRTLRTFMKMVFRIDQMTPCKFLLFEHIFLIINSPHIVTSA